MPGTHLGNKMRVENLEILWHSKRLKRHPGACNDRDYHSGCGLIARGLVAHVFDLDQKLIGPS